jgi:hypothetical protein
MQHGSPLSSPSLLTKRSLVIYLSKAAAASTPHVPDDEMSPQQAAAIKNNEKVFPVFAKKLSSNDKELFCSAIGKLSTWLSSEKAYYAEARPKASLTLMSLDRSNKFDTCCRS